jgi:iron complex transport system ATP-binding protein
MDDISAANHWVLSCDRVCVSRDRRQVLRNVSFELRAGDCLSLIGPNGAGKTTLMLTLLGILRPAAGYIRLNGRDLAGLSARQRARLFSYVPQTIERIPAFTVYDVVAFARFPHVPTLHPLSAQDRSAIRHALEACNLTELARRPVNQLSGGERQKTLIAAAIAQDAQILCLDEPNTALDPAYQVELLQLFKSWHQRRRTLVLISHDLQLPGVLGGRAIALRGGRIVQDGPAEELLEPGVLTEIYGSKFETAETPRGHRLVVPNWWSDSTAASTA